MLSLRDIRNYQIEESTRIMSIGESIHPKLLRRFGYFELFDDSIDAAKLDKLFAEKVNQEIIAYDKKVFEMINEHMFEFIHGWVSLNSETQFGINKVTGEPLTHPTYNVYSNYDDYIIDVGISDYWELVYEMLSDFKVKPYWKYSQILYGDGYRIQVDSSGNGVHYIKYARQKFSGVRSSAEMITNLAQAVESLPYKMILPPLPRETANAMRNDEFNNMIKHHQVLNAFFERYGKDAERGEYWTHTNNDGKIKFMRNDN